MSAAAALILAVSAVAAEEPQAPAFQLIAHPSVHVTSLRRAHVAEVFLKTRVKWDDGRRIFPVDQPIRSAIRAAFLKAVYDKEPRLILRYWQRKIFSGRGHPPPELRSEEEVIEYVRKTPGAIGYVAAGTAPEGVRVIEVTD